MFSLTEGPPRDECSYKGFCSSVSSNVKKFLEQETKRPLNPKDREQQRLFKKLVDNKEVQFFDPNDPDNHCADLVSLSPIWDELHPQTLLPAFLEKFAPKAPSVDRASDTWPR